MSRSIIYGGGLTREQFLFYEMRIAARLYIAGMSLEEAVRQVQAENLFQFPTERMTAGMVRVCYKRLASLENDDLAGELARAPVAVAKQINLYAMMRSNALVWDFMTGLIGEKYRDQDLSFSRGDVNAFFSRLQAQNDAVSGWSDSTITKIKSVLVRALVENEYLDSHRARQLNPVYLHEELEQGIRANGDLEALPAFNRFV